MFFRHRRPNDRPVPRQLAFAAQSLIVYGMAFLETVLSIFSRQVTFSLPALVTLFELRPDFTRILIHCSAFCLRRTLVVPAGDFVIIAVRLVYLLGCDSP